MHTETIEVRTTRSNGASQSIDRAQAELDVADAEIAKLEKQLAAAQTQRESATTRAEFDAARGDADWTTLQLARATAKRDELATAVQALQAARDQERRAAEEAELHSLARRIAEAFGESATAIAASGEALATAVRTLSEFERTRVRSRAAISLERVQLSALLYRLNEQIGPRARLAFHDHGRLGTLELRLTLESLELPEALKGS
ncbi:MAG TPA: hypothetical protein PKA88_19590, partial [Polyangiaceae bacterium]|nr:hypothetical protein [Polyangiaceae bacterium]HMR76692.1 hypothetical protein [Polyangiaceae bacterium]